MSAEPDEASNPGAGSGVVTRLQADIPGPATCDNDPAQCAPMKPAKGGTTLGTAKGGTTLTNRADEAAQIWL